jgi:hypothetical protein
MEHREVSHISRFSVINFGKSCFLGIPSITLDVEFFEPMSIKSFEDDPRKFADAVSLKIANHLGVRLLGRSSGDFTGSV